MGKNDKYWIAAIIGGILLYNLTRPTSVTETQDGQPIAGAGVDLYDSSAYTVEGLAALGGLV